MGLDVLLLSSVGCGVGGLLFLLFPVFIVGFVFVVCDFVGVMLVAWLAWLLVLVWLGVGCGFGFSG